MSSPSSGFSPGGFAANEEDAEAGLVVPVLMATSKSGHRFPDFPQSKTSEKERGTTVDPPPTGEDGPFSQYCTDNAPIWKLYMDQAKISDDNLANIFNSDLDPLLIFAGLFSATLSAFLIEIRKGLQEDLQNITNNLLLVLIENQHKVTGPQVPSSTRFEPTSSSRWVNGLWFSSLMFSLMSALGASLAKGWVTQFSSSVSGSSWGDAAQHSRRFRGLKRWHLKLIVQCLPILIHIAFFLFSIGLVILVFQDDTAIGIVMLILTALILGLYIASSVHSVHSVDSPFRTPLSGMIRRMVERPWRLEAFTAFPEQQEAQKAQALAWLLEESQNGDTITAAIQAIAGLPATPSVQDELLRPASVGLLSRTLSSELAKPASDLEALSSCLYAIIHLVQTAAADAEDTVSPGILGDLIDSEGPLAVTESMPAGIREVALCIKARIWLLIWGNAPDTTLFDTELPVLLKACEPGHLRRLLFQVRLLASRPGNISAASALCPSTDNYCAILRDSNAVNRNQVHVELVKTAASGTDLADSGAQFGARTLLKGMTTGSTELRRCYAELFSDLATDAAFRKIIKDSGAEIEICSLLQTEDDHVRKHVVVALNVFASEDDTRTVITTGLRATINSMLVEDAPVFWAIARFLTNVARHDDIRKNIVASDLLNSIMSRTDPEDEKGFKIAVGLVEELEEYGDIRTVTTATAIVDFCLTHRTAAGLRGLAALAKHDDVLRTISTPQNTDRIVSVLDSLDWRISMSVIEFLLALVMQNSAGGAIFVPKIFDKVISMLGDGDRDVQRAAGKAVVTLANNASVWGKLLPAGNIKGLLKLLENDDERVRRSALDILVVRPEHDIESAALFIPETVDKILALLTDYDNDIQQAAAKAVVALAGDASVREKLLSAGNIKGILKTLENGDLRVRNTGLNVIAGLVENGSECAALFIPETVDKILALLRDYDNDIQQAAVKAVVTLARYASVRENLLSGRNIKRILKMLEDSNWLARMSALNVIAGLVENGSECAAFFIKETIDKILTMLGDQDQDVQQAAVKVVLILANDASVREKLLSAGNIKGLLKMLDNGDECVRRSALDILVVLQEHGIECAAVFIKETIDKIFTMLGDRDQDVQQAAAKVVLILANDASVREKLLSAGNIKGLLKMLDNGDECVRRSALDILVVLPEHGIECAALFIPETIDKIFMMLGDQNSDIQHAAVKAVVTLANDASVREKLLSAGNVKGIFKMLEDGEKRIRRSALDILVVLPEHGIESAALFIPETIDKIFMTLGDENSNIQTAAVKLVVALAPNIPHGIPTPETMQKIIRLLRHEYRAIRNTPLRALDTLASLGEFRSFVSTSQNLVHILQALTGKEDWDDQIISFVKRIISFGHDISSITIAITNATLDGLLQMAPEVRKSYCRVISLLPLAAVTIPLENMQKLLVLLWDRDADIANSAMEILICLTANAQFRKHILSPNVWKLAAKLIQHPPTSRQALKTVIALAKYDDARGEILQSSEIVHTLLTMFKSGTADIDRWEVGLKGLLALGLFS